MSNNTLSPDLQKRIEEEAKAKSDLWSVKMYGDITYAGYIAGATAYALKYEQAKGLFKRVMDESNERIPLSMELEKEIKQFLDGTK